MKKNSKNFNRMIRKDIYFVRPGNDKHMAAVDATLAYKNTTLYIKRAWKEIELKYSRSVFGPLWEIATTVAFVFGFALLGSIIFNENRTEYVAYLTAGIIFWQFFVVNLNESSNAFIANTGEINTQSTSYIGIIFGILLRNLMVMAHNLPLLLAVSYFTGNFSWYTILFIPGLIAIAITFLPINLFVAMVTARYRDTKYAISMVMQFLFYFTPIFWPSESITSYPERLLIELNPFYHMLEIVRAPSLGRAPEIINYIVLFGIFSISLVLVSLVFITFRKRLVYWL
jgi:ABC-type polysaccharide/polyol phosphate export permease